MQQLFCLKTSQSTLLDPMESVPNLHDREGFSFPEWDLPSYNSPAQPEPAEETEVTTLNGKKITIKQMTAILGNSMMIHLKQWDVLGKLARGQWSKENGLLLCTQLLDLGIKVPATLFWFGIIPPIPGKIWSYAFTALSMHGFLNPDGKVHQFLKKWVYPSSFGTAEEEMLKKMKAKPQSH